MIKNKHISKITMLTALFIGGIVNAQEFYTCVPKKNTIMNININNVDELAKAITKIGGVGGGGTNANQKKWKLVTTIDFTKIINDNNLNKNNLLIFDSTFSSGSYKFKLILKDKSNVFLDQFQTIATINNERLFFDSFYVYCYNDNNHIVLNFIKKYNLSVIKFIQNRNLINLPACNPSYNIGIGLLRIGNVALFSYEIISKSHGDKLYDENYIVEQISDYHHRWLSENPLNIFRYSTLEIYKKIGED